MNVHLNVVLEQMGMDEASCIAYIHSLLKEGEIVIDEEIEVYNKKYTLKTFMEQKYSTNKKAQNLLRKYAINNSEVSDKMAYSILRSLLTSIFYEEEITKIDIAIQHFLDRNIPAEKIVNYIYSDEFKESQNNDIYQYIINSFNSVYIFDKVIKNYLGFDNIRDSLFLEISERHYFLNNINAFKVCLANPILKNIQLPFEDYYHALFHSSFDLIRDEKLVDEQEIKHFVNYFFKNHVNKQNPYFCLNDKGIILSRKEWFKEMCGEEDIISVLARMTNGVYGEEEQRADLRGKRFFIRGGQDNIEIIVEALKDKKNSIELKSYLNNRKPNLLVEYLSNGRGIKKKFYDLLSKKLPELAIKDNEQGLLDNIITYKYFIEYIESKNIPLFNSLPLSLLLSHNDKKIIEAVEKMPALKQINYEYDNLYLNFSDLLKQKIQKRNKDSAELKKAIELIRINAKL